MADLVRLRFPVLHLPPGEAGIRRVLAVWLETAAAEAVDAPEGDWQPGV